MRHFIPLFSLLIAPIAHADTTKIIVDIPPLQALIEQLDLPEIEVNVLLEPQGDPHHFSLKPSQAKALSEADYIFGISENFIPEYAKAAQNLNANQDHIHFYEGSLPTHDQTNDPHFWLSPDHLVNIGKFILKQLGEPQRDEAYWKEFQSRNIPIKPYASPTQIPIIASHQAFDHFENYMQIESFGALYDLNDQPLSVREFQPILAALDDGQIKCLLDIEEEHSHEAETLGHDYNLKEKSFDILGWQWQNDPEYFPKFFNALAQVYENCHELT